MERQGNAETAETAETAVLAVVKVVPVVLAEPEVPVAADIPAEKAVGAETVVVVRALGEAA